MAKDLVDDKYRMPIQDALEKLDELGRIFE